MPVAGVAQIETYPRLQLQPELVDAIVVPEMPEDILVRQRAARFIGSVALSPDVQFSPENISPIESLYDAIQLAAAGHEQAVGMIQTNVRTDVIERSIKAGIVMQVDLSVDDTGKIQQFGQSMESVHANSLRFAANSAQMRERTEAETVNAFRIEQLYRAGELDEYNFVVFSRAADNMSDEEMAKAGFFTDTMSCAIQVTSAQGASLTTESAFVAGVRGNNQPRHDKDAIEAVAEYFGADVSNLTASELLGTPLLIHKDLMPNGVIDIVQLYDQNSGGTFFGQDKPVEKYDEYLVKCREREAQLQPIVDDITQLLIESVATIGNRVEAVQLLSHLSGRRLVEQAVFDDEINPKVFGAIAETYIWEARTHFEQGNHDLGVESMNRAKDTETSSSCPTSFKNANGEDGQDGLSDTANGKSEGEGGDCEYVSKKCPICGTKNVKTKRTSTHIEGKCGCSLNLSNGSITTKIKAPSNTVKS